MSATATFYDHFFSLGLTYDCLILSLFVDEFMIQILKKWAMLVGLSPNVATSTVLRPIAQGVCREMKPHGTDCSLLSLEFHIYIYTCKLEEAAIRDHFFTWSNL